MAKIESIDNVVPGIRPNREMKPGKTIVRKLRLIKVKLFPSNQRLRRCSLIVMATKKRPTMPNDVWATVEKRGAS